MERKGQFKIPKSQLLAEKQPKRNLGFLSFLRASVREWLLEISFCHNWMLLTALVHVTMVHRGPEGLPFSVEK
jgi:hypothetical protein